MPLSEKEQTSETKTVAYGNQGQQWRGIQKIYFCEEGPWSGHGSGSVHNFTRMQHDAGGGAASFCESLFGATRIVKKKMAV